MHGNIRVINWFCSAGFILKDGKPKMAFWHSVLSDNESQMRNEWCDQISDHLWCTSSVS